MNSLNTLAERYVAVWNERDAENRRAAIAALWTQDGEHYTKGREVRGYAALEQRVIGSHEKWVKEEGFTFRSANNADGHNGTMKFNWEMVRPDGVIATTGFDFLVLTEDGRIRVDYQYIEPAPRD
jgi:hypothetical protein